MKSCLTEKQDNIPSAAATAFSRLAQSQWRHKQQQARRPKAVQAASKQASKQSNETNWQHEQHQAKP